MLNPRRALIAAAFLLTVFFLVTRSHQRSAATATASTSTSSPNTADDDGHNQMMADAIARGGNVWRSAGPVGQKPMMDTSHMSTYDKLAYAYPYDVQLKFPAYIWQTWKRAPGNGAFEFVEQEDSWSEQHPGFVHEVITDDVAVRLLFLLYASVPEVLEAYHALPLAVLKADFFRYLVLFARGGIYSDIDTYAIRSAVEWIPPAVPRDSVGLVIGIEADPDRPDWADWYSRRIQFCQWTMQSKPGHPVLRDVITRITNRTLALKRAGKAASLHHASVIELTGPAIWTDTIMDYFNDDRFFEVGARGANIDWRNFTGMENIRRVGDVIVLPITAFSPGVEQMGSKDYEDPMAFVKHDFEGTWKPESERHIGEQQESEEASADDLWTT